MGPRKLSDEQIVALLGETEKGEKSIAVVCREVGETEVTFYRWRRKLGGSISWSALTNP